MNKLIGICGKMSSGKTTLCNKLMELNKSFIYINVDEYRRSLYKNEEYINELKNKIKPLKKYNIIDSNILNKYIYLEKNYMNNYKEVLYKYLFNYINTFDNKTILVEWALIIKDNLINKFDKIIYLDIDDDTVLKRHVFSDLSKEEVLNRLSLQEIDKSILNDKSILVIKESDDAVNKSNEFINNVNCKFTLPNNEGKAIWEITHKCNYSCSYCIFSCGGLNVNDELSLEECYKVIDELVKNGFKHLKITGGEPFIRKDIVDILKYASKYLIVDISTNASLITNEIVSKLNEIDLKMIHVSLDGEKLEHESVRGKNTYEATMRGLECLKNSKNKVRIGTVIHKNNENTLENTIKKVIDFNANEIIFSIMEPVEGQDKSLYKTKDDNTLIEEILNLKDKYKNKIIVNLNFLESKNNACTCPGVDKFIYINNHGNISPCPWAYEKNKNLITKGSLRNKTLQELRSEEIIISFLNTKERGKCYGEME